MPNFGIEIGRNIGPTRAYRVNKDNRKAEVLYKYGNASSRHLRISGILQVCCFSHWPISHASKSILAEPHPSHFYLLWIAARTAVWIRRWWRSVLTVLVRQIGIIVITKVVISLHAHPFAVLPFKVWSLFVHLLESELATWFAFTNKISQKGWSRSLNLNRPTAPAFFLLKGYPAGWAQLAFCIWGALLASPLPGLAHSLPQHCGTVKLLRMGWPGALGWCCDWCLPFPVQVGLMNGAVTENQLLLSLPLPAEIHNYWASPVESP